MIIDPIVGAYTPTPAHIHAAWRWWLGFSMQDSRNFKGIWDYNPDIPQEVREEYLMIINDECAKLDRKERTTRYTSAIPKEYRVLAR